MDIKEVASVIIKEDNGTDVLSDLINKKYRLSRATCSISVVGMFNEV